MVLMVVRVVVLGDERAVNSWFVVLHDADLENACETHFELHPAAMVKAQVPVLIVN